MRNRLWTLFFLLSVTPTLAKSDVQTIEPKDIILTGANAPDWYGTKAIVVSSAAHYDGNQYVFMNSFTTSQVHVLFVNAQRNQIDKKSASYLETQCGSADAAQLPKCQVKVTFKLTACTQTAGPLRLQDVKDDADLPRATETTTCLGEGFHVERIKR
ncbi:MAG: hypothetical protein P4L81_08220 [Candidatus Pacebacteria bacterium]|nr:hypothetical protein [Candidatus Paceibacterota bacterium]